MGGRRGGVSRRRRRRGVGDRCLRGRHLLRGLRSDVHGGGRRGSGGCSRRRGGVGSGGSGGGGLVLAITVIIITVVGRRGSDRGDDSGGGSHRGGREVGGVALGSTVPLDGLTLLQRVAAVVEELGIVLARAVDLPVAVDVLAVGLIMTVYVRGLFRT